MKSKPHNKSDFYLNECKYRVQGSRNTKETMDSLWIIIDGDE